MTNLLANAVKYGAGKPVEVRVRRRSGRRASLLSPRPRHRHRPRPTSAHIFERFERAVLERGTTAALGLGLYIVKRIVEAHGGSIRVESAPGAGAAFLVDLPRQPVVALPPVEPVGP